MAKRTMIAIVAELVFQRHEGTGPEQEVEVLAAIFENQGENLIGKIKKMSRPMRDGTTQLVDEMHEGNLFWRQDKRAT